MIFLLLTVKVWCNCLKRNSWVSGPHLFLDSLFSLCFKAVADAGPTSFFSSSFDSSVGGQRESFRRLGTSPACTGFEKVCVSGEEPTEKIKGSESGTREAEVKIDLDDKPRSLLDSLNV